MDINSLLSLNLTTPVPKKFILLDLTIPIPRRLTLLILVVLALKRFTLQKALTLIFLILILLTSCAILDI